MSSGGRRKYVLHGSKRKVSQSKVYVAADTGTQNLVVSNVDLIKIATVASSGGADVKLNITDVYEGQIVYVDFDSNDACDTLVITLNGTASSVDIVTAITANQRSLSRVVVLDAASGAEKGSQSLDNAQIT